MKIVPILFAAASLQGCVSLSEKIAAAPTKSSYTLCENLAVAVLADSALREAWAMELQRRGENCAQYGGTIAASQASNAQAMQLANQLQRRPSAPIIQMGNLLYQSTSGTTRLCTYDKGGQRVTVTTQMLAPCPSSL